MSEKNQNSDGANLENLFRNHGEIVGNICKNATNSFNSDFEQGAQKQSNKIATSSKSSKSKKSSSILNIKSNRNTNNTIIGSDKVMSPINDIVSSKKITQTIEKINNDNNNDVHTDTDYESEQNNATKIAQTGGFFGTMTYKVNIFGIEISVWIIIIVIFIVLCVLYIIYNYFLSRKKIEIISKKKQINFEEEEEEDDDDDENEEQPNEDEEQEQEQNQEQDQDQDQDQEPEGKNNN